MPSLPRIGTRRVRPSAAPPEADTRPRITEVQGEGLTWIHWSRPTYEEVQRLANRFDWHPLDIEDSLIAAHRDLPALMPYLHLPVQSGSDRILDAMNRKHTRAQYLAAIERLREARPDLAFTSDFIVGFPGETENDFAGTLGLVAEIGFSGAFSFKYSPRPGTPGAEMADQVDEAVKSERLGRLQRTIDDGQAAFNRNCLGRTFDVLFERPGRYDGQLVGRSPYLQPVQAIAPASLIGEIAPVTITEIASNSLFGALAQESSQHTSRVPALAGAGA